MLLKYKKLNATPKNLRLCIVSDQLAGGGAERWAAQVSCYFEAQGISVHHVVVVPQVTYPFCGQLVAVGGDDKARGWRRLEQRLQRFRQFNAFFKNESFDLIIDNRVKIKPFQELIIHRWVYRSPYLLMVHSSAKHLYFPKPRWISDAIYRKAKAIVAVSKAIQQRIIAEDHYAACQLFYNPIDLKQIAEWQLEMVVTPAQYILAVGSFRDGVKQFDRLIALYAASKLPSWDIHLVLLGDGPLLTEIMAQAKALSCAEKIHFMGNVANPFPYYKNALYTTLTSRFEGFPTVLIESLATGTPVLSYDCFSGPSEIISHENNGLLIPDQDEEAFLSGMHRLIEDKTVYLRCKTNASQSVSHLDLSLIGEQWVQWFKTFL